MSLTKAVVSWRGDTGRPPNNYSKTIIGDVIDEDAMTDLLDELGDHTLCNCAKYSFNSITAIQFAAPNAAANVDRRAVLEFQDTLSMAICNMEIPAPVPADCEQTSEGERIKGTVLTAIATALNTATGHAYVPLWGKVIQLK